MDILEILELSEEKRRIFMSGLSASEMDFFLSSFTVFGLNAFLNQFTVEEQIIFRDNLSDEPRDQFIDRLEYNIENIEEELEKVNDRFMNRLTVEDVNTIVGDRTVEEVNAFIGDFTIEKLEKIMDNLSDEALEKIHETDIMKKKQEEEWLSNNDREEAKNNKSEKTNRKEISRSINLKEKFKEFLDRQGIYLEEFKEGNKTVFLTQETLPIKGEIDVVYRIDNSQKSFEIRIENIRRIDNLSNKGQLYEMLGNLNRINSRGTYYEKANSINLKYILYYQTVQDFEVQNLLIVISRLLNMVRIHYPEIMRVL